MDYFYNNPSLRKALETYKKQIKYINSIPKAHINNLISTANYAKRLSESNSSIIENVINSRQEILNSISIAKSVNFKRNLFSEDALNNFIKSSGFPKNEILKVSNLMRQSFIKSINVSTFTVTIDSSYPVNSVDTKKYDSVLSNSLNHIFISPSAKFVKNVSITTASGVTTPVLFRTIIDQYVNYFLFSAVIVTLLTCYLIANFFDEENSNEK